MLSRLAGRFVVRTSLVQNIKSVPVWSLTKASINHQPNLSSRFSDKQDYDVVIIGGGPGGYVAAIKSAQLGLKTACVESRGSLGGTCLNVGCIPSKALLKSSALYEDAKKGFSQFGVTVGEVGLDLPKMLAQKSGAVKGLTSGIEGLFKKNKVTYYKGLGSIASTNSVKVLGSDGHDSTVSTKNIVIATGSESAGLPFLPVDEKRIVTSTGALDLEQVPKSMVVVGGGIIGLELGSVWRRLGAQVTVVEFLNSIGGGMDSEVAKNFKRTLEKQGIKFKMGTKVTNADTSGSGVVLSTESVSKGTKEELEADVVLVSIGRKPLTEGLGLDSVGVKMDAQGRVDVDDHWRTNIPNIYAIGDVVKGPMLAHKAEEEGIAVAELIATGTGHVNYSAIPSVVYTHPEVAWVGLTEEELKSSGVDYSVGKFPFMANSRARTVDEVEGMVKVLADKKTDKLLGVHIINNQAGELIAEAVLALEYGASAEDIARTSHAHPTLMEAVKEAAMAANGKPIHI